MDELLGAFALDAVDPAERELVERHLATDPVARAEVDEMRETAAVLASLSRDEEGAPAGLWDRIAGAIGSPDAECDSPGPIPITGARRFNSVPARVFMPAAAAAAIVIAVLALQVATRPSNHAGDLAASYNHALAHGATPVSLQPQSGRGEVSAAIALQPDGSGYFRNAHLAALPAGKTYQLWAIVQLGNEPLAISAGVLGPDPRAAAFHVAGTPAAFAVTVEDAPGVVEPAPSPVAVGRVPV
jgi:Anti-sigma-K factor rskA.